MPAISSSAPGKIILFGEHAVVYERPAIAVPLPQIRAQVYILANPTGKKGEVWLEAPDISLSCPINTLDVTQPLFLLFELILKELDLLYFPSFKLKIKSSIPIASGLGSGTAVSVACIRAISMFLGKPFPLEKISAISYEVEKVYHGTPSGIDNTVITYEKPIFFKRGHPFELIHVASPLSFIVADSGIKSETSKVVNAVRQRHSEDYVRYESFFDEISQISVNARHCLEQGNTHDLGSLMIRNHKLLQEIGVSDSTLDNLVQAALSAGALGAKLSGAGMGGNMIALVRKEDSETISQSLIHAGAIRAMKVNIPAEKHV